MQTQDQRVIHKKSLNIPIKQKLSTQMKINSPKGEYGLKQNFFDPSKSSPPNEFMIKLHMRINRYHIDNNDDNFDME